MKKSQLLKIIKESIKELQRSNLIIEQDTAPEADIEPGMGKVSRKSFSDVAPVDNQSDQQPQAMASQNIPGIMCSLRRCNGPGYTHGGICIPNSIPNSVGDGVILVHLQGPPGVPNYVTYYGHTNKPWFIKTSGAACNAVYNGVPIQVNAYNSFGNQYGNNVNSTQGCWWCCTNSGWTNATPGGACWNACPGNQSSSGCNSSQWSNHQNWINTWTNNNAFNSSNPNQPCNHICQRIQQWTSQIPTVGPQWANMLQCKLDEANNQSSIHGCNC